MKSIELQTDSGVVNVRKLALSDYAELLRSLDQLPKNIGKIIQDNSADDLKDQEKLLSLLPDLLATSLPEFCGLVAQLTDKDKDFISGLGLDEFVEIIATSIELNNFKKVAALLKKAIAVQALPKGMQKTVNEAEAELRNEIAHN